MYFLTVYFSYYDLLGAHKNKIKMYFLSNINLP